MFIETAEPSGEATMDKATGRNHATRCQEREERLMEMWHDPDHWQEALDQISPAALRRGIRETAMEESTKNRHSSPAEPREASRKPQHSGSERLSRSEVADGEARSADERLRAEYLDTRMQAPKRVLETHPGYAPHSGLAPAEPDSPAYESAYDQPKPDFYGLDIGILKVGVNSNGSLDLGVNVGLAKAGVQVGLENRVEGEFMPIGGPLHARVGAGVGVDRSGLHSEVGAGANFFNVVNGDADFGVRVGREIAVDGDVRGRAFPVNVQADAGASVGADGVNAYTGANTDIAGQVGVRAGAHFDLDRYNSGVGAGVGLRAGKQTLDFGPAIHSDGNTAVRPEIHLEPGFARHRTFYPTGNRLVDEQP